jgi:serine/threonine protein kinase
VQLGRIEREKMLIGKNIPHLIEIKDGGFCPETNYLFVAMAYLAQKNLAQVLSYVPRDRIFPITSHIAQAAKALEDVGLVHRDIKPENIALSDDFSQTTLLDLGVLRPIILSQKITDQEGEKFFVGTLQYSPPELLFREEEDSVQGWRAVTFYQLGAVLHDLIMKEPIFEKFCQPFAKLVEAVKSQKPVIFASDVDSNLILLAQTCLLKDPNIRRSLVKWDDLLIPPSGAKSVSAIQDRIRKRKANSENGPEKEISEPEEKLIYKRYFRLDEIKRSVNLLIRNTCSSSRECFPPHEIVEKVMSESSEASISVIFRRSPGHSLHLAIYLIILISLLDGSDEIMEIKYSGLASSDPISETGIESSDHETLYKGPFNEAIIEERISLLLYSLIEKAQQLSAERKVSNGSIQEQIKLNLIDNRGGTK